MNIEFKSGIAREPEQGPGDRSELGLQILAVLAPLWARRNIIVALAVGLLVVVYGLVPFVFGPVVVVEAVRRADFVQSVVASGRVEAPYRVNIGSQITGVVAEVPVEQGQEVKAGDPLVILDDREAKAAVVQAEGAVAQAEARLKQIKELTLPSAEEALAQAKATVENAQFAYDRAEKLARDGVGTRVTLEEATKAIDIARAQLRSAQLQVYTNREGGSDYVLADTQLRQARASLETARSRLSYTVIKAPRDGVLILRDVERGNIVQPSNVLMKLSPFGKTQLVVLIDEKNLGFVALGQKALASADAFPKETFPAQVSLINPGVDLQRASVEVKLTVAEPPAYLRQDMTVSVDIETTRHPKALIISAANLRGLSTVKPYVLKVKGLKAVRQPVKVGLVSGGKAEILDGLAEGDLVVPAAATVTEGKHLRARQEAAAKP
ncbi:MAG: efflux RND transporter periplasmic adaptor subunit [Hyphomicrobiales bacterium]|nr:MAG: efflux RND transporter periplasmic adaptor subunit [Hyphomicrobiales bacterium]